MLTGFEEKYRRYYGIFERGDARFRIAYDLKTGSHNWHAPAGMLEPKQALYTFEKKFIDAVTETDKTIYQRSKLLAARYKTGTVVSGVMVLLMLLAGYLTHADKPQN